MPIEQYKFGIGSVHQAQKPLAMLDLLLFIRFRRDVCVEGVYMALKRTIAFIAIISAVAAITANGIAGAAETINYSYDAKGRLVKVVHSGNVNNNITANYVFDKADNRKAVTVTGAP